MGGVKMLDIRTKKALEVYEKNSKKIIIKKTTRAGGTTSFIIAAVLKKEQIVVVVPTKKIGHETIERDIKNLIPSAVIQFIPANDECIKIQKEIKKYPDLKGLPFLPLYCKGCKFECSMVNLEEIALADVIILTYDKLDAILSSDSERANEIKNIITSADNVLFDEHHTIMFQSVEEVPVFNDGKYIPLLKYNSIKTLYLNRVIGEFETIIRNTKKYISDIYKDVLNENYWIKHPCKSLDNPSKGIVEHENPTKVFAAAYSEIVNLMKHRNKFGLTTKEILQLYNMLNIVMSKIIVISGKRNKEFKTVSLSAENNKYARIKTFANNLNCRVLITSATLVNESDFFAGEYDTVDFGDPLNTNSKLLILADTKNYSTNGRYSCFHFMNEIVSSIIKVQSKMDCKIVAINKATARDIEEELKKAGCPHEVDYYRSENTIGVSSDCRNWILVSAAWQPLKSFVATTTNLKESDKRAIDAMHSVTFQTLSRAKDPNGIEDSFVFALGINEKTMKEICGTVTVIRCKGIDEMLEAYNFRTEKVLASNILNDYIKNAEGKYLDIPGPEFTEKLKAAGYSPSKVKEDWFYSGIIESNDLERIGTYKFKKNGVLISGIRIKLAEASAIFI